jgi:hypothetical protein
MLYAKRTAALFLCAAMSLCATQPSRADDGGALVHPRTDHTATLLAPTTGLWKTSGSLTVPRIDFTANLLNDGKVFAAAGSNQPFEAGLASVEEFDPSTGGWLELPTLLVPPRYQHTTTTLLDGSLIVAGGFATGFGDFAPNGQLFVRPEGEG